MSGPEPWVGALHSQVYELHRNDYSLNISSATAIQGKGPGRHGEGWGVCGAQDQVLFPHSLQFSLSTNLHILLSKTKRLIFALWLETIWWASSQRFSPFLQWQGLTKGCFHSTHKGCFHSHICRNILCLKIGAPGECLICLTLNPGQCPWDWAKYLQWNL